MADSEITHWLELPVGTQAVNYEELPHRMANAKWPNSDTDAEAISYGWARHQYEENLPKAAMSGRLKLRDPLTAEPLESFDFITLKYSEATVSALRPYLAELGIGIRFVEHGNGPTHWTIENAAAAIAAQERWHGGARDTLRQQMMQAARDGTLTVRHPHTDLPYRPDPVRDFYELVTPADVNAWMRLDRGSSLRWKVGESQPAAGTTAPTDGEIAPVTDEAPPVNRARSEAPGWKDQARGEARRIRKECAALGRFPGLENLGDEVARIFRERGITGSNGHALAGTYIKRHALQGQDITANTDRLKATLNKRGK